MKTIPFVLALLFCSVVAAGQDKQFSVLGKVIDGTTGQPLIGASVYCDNTTHGTITNNEGLFFLRLSNGGYDLVITYTGYSKATHRLSNNAPLADTLVIELNKEEKSLTEVAVVASNEVPDGLEKYGQFFMDRFIGTTPNAALCRIENPEVLHFFYSKKRNRLKVTAHEDLIISNYALGYTVRYQLDSFSYDYNAAISLYTGSPFFIEMDSTEEMKALWKKNRALTYTGSRLHFMRALYDNMVMEEGFIVEKLETDSQDIISTIITDIANEEDYVADSADVTINWSGRYRISYRHAPPHPSFLTELNLPPDMKFQVTVIDCPNGFVIEENGYFYEQHDVVNTGYWAWKKLAELLPYDYEYE